MFPEQAHAVAEPRGEVLQPSGFVENGASHLIDIGHRNTGPERLDTGRLGGLYGGVDLALPVGRRPDDERPGAVGVIAVYPSAEVDLHQVAGLDDAVGWPVVRYRGVRPGRHDRLERECLRTALEHAPSAFPPLYVATVRAAERTSDLAPALSRYVAYQAQLEAIKKRVVNASIYPLLLIAVGGLVSLFLLFYVVPRFGRIYEDRATDLPVFSKLLLAWGSFAQANAGLALGLLVALVVLVVYSFKSYKARISNALWRIPGVGERLKVYQLARFYRTTGMLLKGGMPLVAALDMAAELLHPVLRERLVAASRAISEGRGVSASMDANGLTTPVAMRMLVVGESSGSMGDMMDRIAGFHDDELARWVDWFTRMFEPILMAVIGLVIGAIVVLMYMPIFELAGNLQ